jgi:murein DD-endopeptidase MepM/ murein hydrolase activator NlpD
MRYVKSEFYGVFVFFAILMVFGVALMHFDVRAQTATNSAGAAASTTIGEQLQQKSQQLAAINAALDAAKKSLTTAQAQRVTLQSQLTSINGNINTLNLGIRADTVTSEQLALEIQQMASDLGDITQSVAVRQAAIGTILEEMQKNDMANGNLLALFLKSGTLANGVLEANSILDLQEKLASDITALRTLRTQYEQDIADSNAKKNQIAAHQTDLQNKKSIVQDQQQEKQALLTQTKNQESAFQKQYTALQKEQQQISSDIESLDAILRQKVNPATLPALQPGVLLVPVQGDDRGDITQGYGATSFAKNGYQGHWHNGVDFAASIGTPVLAAEDGTVAATGNQDAYCRKGAYGKFIVINHTDGLTTLYGHLSRQVVVKGDAVKRGQLIGYSGQTGYATGPHLHFTVYAQSTFYMGPSKTCGPMPYGGDLNPLGYLF